MSTSSYRSDQIYADARQLLQQALQTSMAAFRPGQFEAIQGLVRGRKRMLVVQRTGWGKSLVYFLATRLLRNSGSGPTLLVSPLLALMRNQIQMAENIGLRAMTMNSTNKEQWEAVEDALEAGQVDILLISPERLGNEQFRERVLSTLVTRIGLLVVDEAHCISDWGHDFRPDYRRIGRILQLLPRNIPVAATTATANDRVIDDVHQQLGADLEIIRGPIKRESLRLQNVHLPRQSERLAWLAETLPRLPGSGIIYTLTIHDARNVAEWLQRQGINAHAYWGALANEQRVMLEQQLLDNRAKALVATSALGMGFDKPDLGFVIHFQRPGSVIHYYQQIGRAGRALDNAYAILLSGDEDDAIADYFRETAFPPHAHVEELLAALNASDSGLSIVEIERSVNLSRSQIQKALRILSTESPAPVARNGSKWVATPVRYQPDVQRIEQITALRQHEQARMQEYMTSESCLMVFLETELGAIDPAPCGRCAPCTGRPVVPESASMETIARAGEFLRRRDYVIQPRMNWASPGIPELGMTGRIDPSLRHEEGRSLSLWRDSGWGELVYAGKFLDHRFDQRLVDAAAELIRQRWKPDPPPTWITCVPSLDRTELVPDFAARLARALKLPFHACVEKTHWTDPQKQMKNSFRQLQNVAGSFNVSDMRFPEEPVLLVDDIFDSRWTLTVVAAQLRAAGSGPVYPFTLSRMFGTH